MKLKTQLALGTVAVVAAFAFFAGRGSSMEALRPTPAPPVLEKIQALGQLHTARYTYQNVFEHATARETADWARNIPGVESLVQNSTRNSGLVQVHAEVEAGVDLAKAHLENRPGQAPRLVLPHAVVYRPQVDAKVYDVRRGMFWRDDNFALNAVTDAQIRLRTAARQQGIVRTAEENAVKQIRELTNGAEIVFQG